MSGSREPEVEEDEELRELRKLEDLVPDEE